MRKSHEEVFFPTSKSSVSSTRLKQYFLLVSSAVSPPFLTPPFTPGVRSMAVPKIKRLKSLEEENVRLGKLLAQAMLDKERLQVALGESTDDRPEAGNRVRGHVPLPTSCLQDCRSFAVNLRLFGSAASC